MGPKVDAPENIPTHLRPLYLFEPHEPSLSDRTREFEKRMANIYLRGLAAEKLLVRWADWARAHGYDVGMLDDTRAFLSVPNPGDEPRLQRGQSNETTNPPTL